MFGDQPYTNRFLPGLDSNLRPPTLHAGVLPLNGVLAWFTPPLKALFLASDVTYR